MQRSSLSRGSACGSQLQHPRPVCPSLSTCSTTQRRTSVLARASADKPKEEEQDLVTRWVGKIFGKAAVEDRTPFGLKRMDWDQVRPPVQRTGAALGGCSVAACSCGC